MPRIMPSGSAYWEEELMSAHEFLSTTCILIVSGKTKSCLSSCHCSRVLWKTPGLLRISYPYWASRCNHLEGNQGLGRFPMFWYLPVNFSTMHVFLFCVCVSFLFSLLGPTPSSSRFALNYVQWLPRLLKKYHKNHSPGIIEEVAL